MFYYLVKLVFLIFFLILGFFIAIKAHLFSHIKCRINLISPRENKLVFLFGSH